MPLGFISFDIFERNAWNVHTNGATMIRVALGDLRIMKPRTLQTNTIAHRLNYEKQKHE